MPKKTTSAVEALNKLLDEQKQMAERAAIARQSAALELGLIALDAGAAALTAEQLEGAIASALTTAAAASAKSKVTARSDGGGNG